MGRMQIDPSESAPIPRRRFQFRLQTLLIVVTLLAVPMAYVGWQAKIVTDRRHLRELIAGAGGTVTVNLPAKSGTNPAPLPQPNWLRSLLGDEPAGFIIVPSDVL